MNMSDAIIQKYWEDGAVVQQSAAAAGQLTLVEHLAWQGILRRNLNAGRRRIRILDVGTGAGVLPIVLAKMRHVVTGIDRSDSLLTVARQRAYEAELKCDFVISSAESLQFPTSTFDAITAVGVLSHLAYPLQAVQEWVRVLKPGGRVLIAEDDLDSAELSLHRQATYSTEYRKAWARMPLGGADSAELAALLDLAMLQNINVSRLSGQLARTGQWRRKPYSIGYTLLVAEKAVSKSLPLSMNK